MSLSDFWKKYSGIVSIILLIGFSVSSTSVMMTAQTVKGPVGAIVSTLASIEGSIDARPEFAVEILVYEANKCTTAQEIRDKVDMWEAQGWGVQLSAMKHVATSESAIGHLKDMIAYPEVSRAFLARILTF